MDHIEATFTLFRNDREATFLRRPNRFRVEVLCSDIPRARGKEDPVPAHCPNPGRLLELLLPGTRVILERTNLLYEPIRAEEDQTVADQGLVDQGFTDQATAGAMEGTKALHNSEATFKGSGVGSAERSLRKTQYTLVAAYRTTGQGETRVVPLYSSRLNRLAEALVLPRLFPDARKIRREVHWEPRQGSSRFDFFVRDAGGKEHFLEVKGCTLVEYGVAMFPDAPSSRAVRHLKELADAARAGYEAHVVFILTHGPVAKFIPNLHTDPEFASTLSEVSPYVRIHAVEAEADREGRARILREDIPVDLSHGKLSTEDRGSYLVTLRLNTRCRTLVGSLGEVEFMPGWYVYAGSAQRSLSSRVARHLRLGGMKNQRKKLHWHIDYLSAVASEATGYPIASYRNLECDLAKGLAEIGGKPVEGFGASDCRCGSHLFYFEDPQAPKYNRQFVDLVLRFRHLVFSE